MRRGRRRRRRPEGRTIERRSPARSGTRTSGRRGRKQPPPPREAEGDGPPLRRAAARCHRSISADRAHPAETGGGARTASSAPGPPRGEGGEAWGSRGRSGRHALGRAAGASCVQRLDDSRNSAIHTTYRISLRSSSLREPRYPLLRVVAFDFGPPGRGEAYQSVVRCFGALSRRAPLGEGRGGRFVKRPRARARRRATARSRRRGGSRGADGERTPPRSAPGPRRRRAAAGSSRAGAAPAVARLRRGAGAPAAAPPGAAPRIRPRFAVSGRDVCQ